MYLHISVDAPPQGPSAGGLALEALAALGPTAAAAPDHYVSCLCKGAPRGNRQGNIITL